MLSHLRRSQKRANSTDAEMPIPCKQTPKAKKNGQDQAIPNHLVAVEAQWPQPSHLVLTRTEGQRRGNILASGCQIRGLTSQNVVQEQLGEECGVADLAVGSH